MSEEAPAAQPETKTEEQPAAAEQPAAEEPKADDQPAVTEVTEVKEEPAAAEGEAKEGEKKEEPKEEEPKEKPKEEEKKEVKKKEPKPKVEKPPPDYRTVKAAWVQKQGVIFKSFKRYYMTLDEDGSVLRWWKTEQRTGSDGALFMKYCAEVTEPNEQYNTNNWPADTEERRFIVCSPHRAFFLVAESAEDRNDWLEKLKEAMGKYKEENVKVITTSPMSVESFKASISKAADDTEATLQKEGISEKKKEEETPKAEGEAGEAAAAAAPASEEPKPKEEAKPEGGEVTVEVDVETKATEEPPKTEEEAEKKEEDKPAEGGEAEAKAD